MRKFIGGVLLIITSIVSSSFVFAAEGGTKSFSSLLEKKIMVHFDIKKEIPSPVFSYTGVLTTGTTKAILKWKHGTTSESFPIVTSGRKAILLSMRLDYHNIGPGKNRYTLSLWEDNQLSEIRFFNVDSNYEEKQLGSTILYINEQFTTPEQKEIYLNGENSTTEVFPIHNSYLARYGDKFYTINDYFIYSVKENQLYEYRNLEQPQNITDNSDAKLEYGDLYLNGALLLEDIPLVYHGAEAKNSLVIDYKPQTSQLDIYWSDEDGGGSFNSRRNFKLPSGELLLAVDVYNEWGDKDIAIIENQHKKLKVFSLTEEGDTINGDKFSLKYQYYVKKNQERELHMEDFLVKDKIQIINNDLPLGNSDFSYSFNPKTNLLRVERDRSLGGKAEVYVWSTKTFPIFYKSLK